MLTNPTREGAPSISPVPKDGKQQLIGAYVDDLTICLEDPSQMSDLMTDLRKRFTIKESEGGKIDWLLGMRIHQNPEEGHISIDQELAITKLAKAVLTQAELDTASKVVHPMLHSVSLPRYALDNPLRIKDKKLFTC